MTSCGSAKINTAEKFYSKWEKDSKPISKIEYNQLNILQKKVYDVYEVMVIELSKNVSQYNHPNAYPNLKYIIIEPSIFLSLCDSIVESPKQNISGYSYKGIGNKQAGKYILKPRSDTLYKLLYYTDKYKEILKKRGKFYTPSVFGFKNDSRAFAIFNGRVLYPSNKMYYNDPLTKITSVVFTKKLDEAILITSSTFGMNWYYFKYDKKTKIWSYKLFNQLSIC